MSPHSLNGSVAWSISSEPLLVALAETDDVLRAELADELRQEGYEVVELHDGNELEDYLDTAQDGFLAVPDVIVSEADMPGQSGLSVLAHLRSHQSVTPFILINSRGDPSTFEQAEALGADFVLQTPLDLEELRRVVHIAA